MTRGGWTLSHALFIVWWFLFISIYTYGREFNVINSGMIVLVTTNAAIASSYHVIFTPNNPKYNCASRKQQNVTHKSKNLEDSYILVLFKEMHKRILTN